MSKEFEIRDPDTGELIERIEREDFPLATRRAMAVAVQEALNRRIMAFTGERDATGKPIYCSTIYEGKHREN